MELFKQYGQWFIQFPKFAYILVEGCPIVPLRLRRYTTNKLIMLELTRQMIPFEEILQLDLNNKGLGVEFPLRIGTLESCPSIQRAQHFEKEMAQFELYSDTNRNHFDPYGRVMKLANMKF